MTQLFADDVGTPIFRSLLAPGAAADAIYVWFLLFIAAFVILAVIIFVLRKIVLRKEHKK